MSVRFFYCVVILCFCGCLLSSCGALKKQRAHRRPEKARVITSDVDHFWEAFDRDRGRNQAINYQTLYINRASPGLKRFIRLRIGNANQLTRAIYENRELYEAVQNYKLQPDSVQTALAPYLRRLKAIYPGAIFPDIYLMIGANNSAGTISGKGLLIGLERLPGQYALYPVIVHELIHYQQQYYFLPRSFTLLEQSIKEGSADFLSELVTGIPANGPAYSFGAAHETSLKKEFEQLMHRKWAQGWEGWMYGGAKDGRPDDLAYWIGYQITKAYFDKASDKKAAVKEILTIRNFERFADQSGYFNDPDLTANPGALH